MVSSHDMPTQLELDYQQERHYYANLVNNQRIARLSSFTLESGQAIFDVPIAYKTWGELNAARDNILVVCHALTGSSDVEDWWRPLMGSGRAFDPRKFFVFCANLLGSPYGSASPLTVNPETGKSYGAGFPHTTIRDDVRIQKLVLDALGVKSVAAVVGGSMGGMLVLEWPLCTPPGFVKRVIPIATSAFHSAWGISWGYTQRQCIYSDPVFCGGTYDAKPSGQPKNGLGTARMIGMLTYRSSSSFAARFGRSRSFKKVKRTRPPTPPLSDNETGAQEDTALDRNCSKKSTGQDLEDKPWSAQTYLDYQADKFLQRFDANCYIHLTTKMDSHDITRGRTSSAGVINPNNAGLKRVCEKVPPRALVIRAKTDMLFPAEQQLQLASCLPEADFLSLDSHDGHDGFLLEFEALNAALLRYFREHFPALYQIEVEVEHDFRDPVVDSVFGEAESEFN